MIFQGDQYYLPFIISDKDENGQKTTYTPENVKDARIQVYNQQYVYSKGTLFFKDGFWYVPLTQDQTRNFPPIIEMQTQIKLNTTPETVKTSLLKKEPIQKCICQGEW